MTLKKIALLALAAVTLANILPVMAGGDVGTKFSNQGTIGNTRHNLTQRATSGGTPNSVFMDPYRNDYQQVCVYCHTPHGANTNISIPLWNRTVRDTTYTVYNQANLTSSVSQPGANSLACLTCHDGQTAMDSIVNMPGSGGYNSAQMTTQNNSFLDTWTNASGIEADHGAFDTSGTGCLSCHQPTGTKAAADFTVALIGTDLRNDHPVGVRLRTGPDWKVPTGVKNGITYFDLDGDNSLSKGDIRFYDTGDGPEVECASCHDPHGVPSGSAGSAFISMFLRVDNAGSKVCLTCHTK